MTPKLNDLVGPKGHFLLGNLPEFRKDGLAFLTHCAQAYGEIVPLQMLHLPVYLLLNSAHIEYLLITRSRDFLKSRMYKLMDSLLGQGLGTSEGDFWLRQRRLMQPAFHHERIQAYGESMVACTEHMLSTWQEGQILEMTHAAMNLSLAIMAKALLSCDMADDTDDLSAALKEVAEVIAIRFSSALPLPEALPTPTNLRYQRSIQRVEQVVYRLIQQRRAKPEADTGDLLSMLLHAQDEDGNQMTDRQLRDEMVTSFVAGTDTTSASVLWTWYLLSQHPQVEAKLLAEVDAVLGGRNPTVADLPNLHYLDLVYTEALRWCSPGPLLGREATKDFEMGGYHFPAGTEFWISPWAMHHNPRYFEAPDEFRPERWEGDLAKRLPKFAYMPFSHGPRGCIGSSFAKMEAKLILATVAQRFHLELLPGQMVEPGFSMTVLPKHGIKMLLTEYLPAPQAALPAGSVYEQASARAPR